MELQLRRRHTHDVHAFDISLNRSSSSEFSEAQLREVWNERFHWKLKVARLTRRTAEEHVRTWLRVPSFGAKAEGHSIRRLHCIFHLDTAAPTTTLSYGKRHPNGPHALDPPIQYPKRSAANLERAAARSALLVQDYTESQDTRRS